MISWIADGHTANQSIFHHDNTTGKNTHTKHLCIAHAMLRFPRPVYRTKIAPAQAKKKRARQTVGESFRPAIQKHRVAIRICAL